MLWYKSWLETRWRFVIGLVLLIFSACSAVLTYPRWSKLLPLTPTADVSGEIGRAWPRRWSWRGAIAVMSGRKCSGRT